ncbi:MAG TPA: hypothetical protein VHG92_01770 [Afifellaceae bacterium]|nr:hypothetical protein [Afifellaceae bacterium]
MSAVEAVEAGTATLDQAREVLAMARLSKRADLVTRASAIIDNSAAATAGVCTPAKRTATVDA